MTGTHRIVFTPSGLTGEVESGTTVLAAARATGVDLDSVCGGRGICGRCQVSPTIGSFPKWEVDSTTESLATPPGTREDPRGRKLAPGNRLGCSVRVVGDVVVDVPVESRIHRQIVRKELAAGPLDVDPLIGLHYLEIPPADPAEDVGETALVRRRLAEEWGLGAVTFAPHVLPVLQPALAAGRRAVTVAVHHGRAQVVAVRPGYDDTVHGLAVDIGSTTIAVYLCDLHRGEVVAAEGAMNPQIRFGEDLMSRVSHAMTAADGAPELTRAVREGVDSLVTTVLARAGVHRRDVLDIVVVGNPVMHHLVLGIDPSPLGVAPFTLATAEAVHAPARDVGIDCPAASVYVPPCIGGHIGADAVAAILADDLHHATQPRVLVDVGTNAEILLSDGRSLFAASSPTGPALEGAQISCGVRAGAGAIERVRIDRETLEPRVRVIGCDLWSDEPGFAEATADLDIAGVCGSGIVEIIGELFLAGVLAPDGTMRDRRDRTDRVVADERTFSYVLQWAGEDPHRRELRLTQADVRAVQLAKAALRAGIDLLRERSGVAELGSVGLAGAFGAHLDPLYAVLLGLVPDAPPDTVAPVGNAAGAGAVAALLSGRRRGEIEAAVTDIVRVETATEPRFQDLFVKAMAIPHADPTPVLATLVDLPESEAVTAATGRSRRRRRNPPVEREGAPRG